MYKKILVALDHSPARQLLTQKAIAMAQALEADLMLVHVLSAYDESSPGLPVKAYHVYYPIVDSAAWDTYQKRWQAYEKAGLEELGQLADEAASSGVKADFTQAVGDPGRVICDLATSWKADLIMVGNRGRTGLSELLLGSVSNYVMHHAPCSVLVAHDMTTQAKEAHTDAKATVNT